MAQSRPTEPTPPLPSPEDFLLSVPLYKDFPYDEDDGGAFFDIEYFQGTLDCYCEGCGRHSVFRSLKRDYQKATGKYVNYLFSLRFECSRNVTHGLFFLFRAHQGNIQKIGQYPSLADLTTPDLQKYRKVLGGERFREFTRAVGLASHGVGIGAFVYLRRIFEALIEKARAAAAVLPGWNQEQFRDARMDDKIALLKAHLPPFLVENRALYGILSTGIHSLTEDACLKVFPMVKVAIELILDEELERAQRDEKVEAARKGLSALSGQLKQGER